MSLPWKANHPELPTNYHVAKRRFQSLFNRLDKQPELLETYHSIIEKQLEEGVVEVAPEKPESSREHYILHKPVVREHVESTKVRIVYDASAKADDKITFVERLLGHWSPTPKTNPRYTITQLNETSSLGW